MHAATIELLEELGAADRLIAQGRVLDQLRFTDAGRTLVRVGFDHIPSRYRFALAVPQSTTERVLTERLAELGGTVERELEAESVQAVPGGYRVGGHHADGTRSPLPPASWPAPTAPTARSGRRWGWTSRARPTSSSSCSPTSP